MKRVICAAVVALAFGSSAAMACPAGSHLVGGTGAHHKGGTCSATYSSKAKHRTASTKAHAKHRVASTKHHVKKSTSTTAKSA